MTDRDRIKPERPTVYARGNIALVAESPQTPRYRRRLTRRAKIRSATTFLPRDPNETSEHHFPLQTIAARSAQSRFINRYDSREILILILVDGSCIRNGDSGKKEIPPTARRLPAAAALPTRARAGDGNVALSPSETTSTTAAARSGSRWRRAGRAARPSTRRATARSCGPLIAALEFRAWQEEGLAAHRRRDRPRVRGVRRDEVAGVVGGWRRRWRDAEETGGSRTGTCGRRGAERRRRGPAEARHVRRVLAPPAGERRRSPVPSCGARYEGRREGGGSGAPRCGCG
ncbi:hypothetical protein Hte_001767 [Hypoxylon texense]